MWTSNDSNFERAASSECVTTPPQFTGARAEDVRRTISTVERVGGDDAA